MGLEGEERKEKTFTEILAEIFYKLFERHYTSKNLKKLHVGLKKSIYSQTHQGKNAKRKKKNLERSKRKMIPCI